MKNRKAKTFLSTSDCGKRSGITLVTVLVLLSVATIIMITALQASIRQRRQLRQELQLEQTKWLVDAGVRKSLLELDNDPEFEGKTIDLSGSFAKYEIATLELKRNESNGETKVDTMQVNAVIEPTKESSLSTKRSHDFPIE